MSTRTSLQSAAYNSRATSSTSLVTPSLSVLADPPVRLVDAAAYDYLVIEMVHALRDSAEVATKRVEAVEDEMRAAGLLPAPPPPEKEKVIVVDSERAKRETRSSIGSAGIGVRVGSPADSSGSGRGADGTDTGEEGLRLRLEAIGVHIGGNIAERCAFILNTPISPAFLIMGYSFLDYVVTDRALVTHSTRSSLSAKMSGPHAGTSRSITCVPTIA